MRVLIKKRGAGKTTQMIYTSEATGMPIIVDTYGDKVRLMKKAISMNCSIPEPMTIVERRHSYNREDIRNGLLIDNAETICCTAINYYFYKNNLITNNSFHIIKNVTDIPDNIDLLQDALNYFLEANVVAITLSSENVFNTKGENK